MRHLPLCLLFIAACDPFGPNKTGDNGVGNFHYECVGATDPTCQANIVDQTFPAEIALGALFGVGFTGTSSTAISASVQPAAAALLRSDNGNLRATEPGYAGLVAINGDGRVVDFTHLLIATPADYAVLQNSTTPALAVMTAGASQTVFASPLDDNGFSIAGAVPATWSVSDSSVLELVQTSPAVSMTINASSIGKSTLTVTASGISRSVDISVEAAP